MNEHPYVGPPPGGLEAAIREARRRRWRTAGVGSGSAMGLVVVVAALLAQTGTQSLTQAPDTEVPAVVGVDDAAPGREDAERANTIAPDQLVGGPAAPSSVTPAQGTGTSPTSVPRGVTAPAGRPGDAAGGTSTYRAGPLTTEEYVSVNLCPLVSSGGRSTTLCPTTWTQPGSRPGTTQLHADVCSADANRDALHFPGQREVDFTVRRGGTVVWRWSTWHPDNGPAHLRALSAGSCVAWSFVWTQVDRDGDPLPPGAYTLQARFEADELASDRVLSVDFTI